MRILVTGDRYWVCNRLAANILRRLIDRYGSEIVIVPGAATGVDESFATACKGFGIVEEAHPADWDRLGNKAGPVRNGEMVRAGTSPCTGRSVRARGCCRQAIDAGIPTYLIQSEEGKPRRLALEDCS